MAHRDRETRSSALGVAGKTVDKTIRNLLSIADTKDDDAVPSR